MGGDIVEGGSPEVREEIEVKKPEGKKSRMVWALRHGMDDTELGEEEAEARPIE